MITNNFYKILSMSNKSKIDDNSSQLADLTYSNAGAHNSIYRGKYLGDSLTSAQSAEIAAGTFDDLYIGDYWTIGGVNYRIAAFDYYYNVGDTAFTTHHAVVVPDTVLYNARMNATNDTTGGYVNSEMRTANLASAISTITTAFSGHVLTHRQLLVNATSSGKSSGWTWVDCQVEIMSEMMVYGASAWGESTYNNGYSVGSSKQQLPLFALRPDLSSTRQTYWLRDVVSTALFALADFSGYASYLGASRSYGVRPAFLVS